MICFCKQEGRPVGSCEVMSRAWQKDLQEKGQWSLRAGDSPNIWWWKVKSLFVQSHREGPYLSKVKCLSGFLSGKSYLPLVPDSGLFCLT